MNVLSVLTNSTEQEPRDYSPLCMCKTKVQWVSLENRLFVRDDINASICLFTLKHLKLVWWSHGSHGSIKTQAYIDFLLRLWEKRRGNEKVTRKKHQIRKNRSTPPKNMKNVWSLIPHICMHPFICVHHSWFTFIMFNFKYYLGEW